MVAAMPPSGRRRPSRVPPARPSGPRVVAAPDKFRETATAREITDAVIAAADGHGWSGTPLPMADGGEGTLEVLASGGGVRRRTVVSGPLGDPVEAEWLLAGTTAYVEMARASGLTLVGG